MAKEDRDGDKMGREERDSGKVEVEGKCKGYNSIAQLYMHTDQIYLLQKLALVVRF